VFESFLIAFGLVFVAELGDKSQLMSLAFATRFKPWLVLTGVAIAAAVMQMVSVTIGGVVGASLPTDVINIISAAAFVAFGIWTLRNDDDSDEDIQISVSNRHALLTITSMFFISEIGDKTMLATVTLATKQGIFGTWLGATLGMTLANALAVVVGRAMGTRLPQKTIRIGAAVLFFIFAIVLVVDVIR
jgi:putative Ca2+/H+ antiporter (TMEM165/GDT1 family)